MIKFTTLAAAQSFRDRCDRIMLIVGAGAEFWVVTPRTAERLISWGHQYAE